MNRWLPELVLIGVTAIWGATFAATRLALHDTSPAVFLLIRFTVGVFVLVCFLRRKPTQREVKAGGIVGLVMLVGYAFQTIGLQTVDASRSAFITALYVPLVPLLQAPLTGKRPGSSSVAGAILAFVGLTFLSMQAGFSIRFGVGEVLTLGCAVASALQIVLTSKFAHDGESAGLTVMQLGTVGVGSLTLMPFYGAHVGTGGLMIGIAMGVFATAGAIFGMNWSQKTVSPTRATLLYALEPVWAAVIGVSVGEKVLTTAIVGGAFVLLGIVVGEVLPKVRRVFVLN